MEFVMSLCTRVVVLAEGKIIAEGAPDEVRGDPERHRRLSRALSRPIDPILALEDVVAGYGKMTILNGTSFTVARGAITTVIGPNGAGKSTVFKTIFGLLRRARGRIAFDGARHHRTSRRAQLLDAGICYVPQGRNIFPELSRAAQPGAGRRRRAPSGVDLAARIEARDGPLSRCCGSKADAQASTLSGGEQKLLEIARGCCSSPS